jgi:anti-sigma factor (TIGR02949 family)
MAECPGIPCGEAMARLWDYIDGELTPETEARVKTHLDACAHCYPELDFHRGFCEFLRRTREAPIPPELRRRVFLSLLRAESEPGS